MVKNKQCTIFIRLPLITLMKMFYWRCAIALFLLTHPKSLKSNPAILTKMFKTVFIRLEFDTRKFMACKSANLPKTK